MPSNRVGRRAKKVARTPYAKLGAKKEDGDVQDLVQLPSEPETPQKSAAALEMDRKDEIRLPSDDEKWAKNETRAWPKVTYEDLVDHLINAKAYDGKEMRSFRALYGYNYVQNGWMGDIYHCMVGNLHYLKATVSPSQPGVGRNDYKSWVCISKDDEVLTGHCTCPAGNGRSCSHISAIIYAVTMAWKHGLGGMTCTDTQVAWDKSAAKVLNHEKLSDMSFKRPDPAGTPIVKERNCQSLDKMPAPVQFCDHDEFVQHVQQSSIKNLWLCKGTMLNRIVSAPDVEMNQQISVVHGSHEVETSSHVQVPLDCKVCQDIFEKYVAISEVDAFQLERRTASQDLDLWSDARKFRITSSRVNSLPKTERGDPNKFVNAHIYNRFKGCPATRHGQKSEAIARSWFEDISGDKVSKAGLVIHPKEPYIGASPDGLIRNDTVLEIKCPTRPLQELIASGKYDVLMENGHTILNPKGKNGYYCQVQFSMFCTGKHNCKFVVWTADHAVMLNVSFNKDYVEALLPRVRRFYFSYLQKRFIATVCKFPPSISSCVQIINRIQVANNFNLRSGLLPNLSYRSKLFSFSSFDTMRQRERVYNV